MLSAVLERTDCRTYFLGLSYDSTTLYSNRIFVLLDLRYYGKAELGGVYSYSLLGDDLDRK